MARQKSAAQSSIRRHLLVAGLAAVLLIAGMGGWAATTEIAGAVIAPGHLVTESNVKRVQHPSGGIVAAINVREGDMVEAGEELLRLDDTAIRANLGIVLNTLHQLSARQARLIAERDGATAIDFPAELLAEQDDPEVAEFISGERQLFDLRNKTREGFKAQLTERIAQLGEEIAGLTAQRDAKRREIALLKADLEGLRSLLADQLIQAQRVSDLERELAAAEGQEGQATAAIAQARGRIAETELQILQIDQNARSEVAAELADVQARVAEYSERRIAGEGELAKTSIRSPQNGQVHQLTVHTASAVIGSGEVVMQIVPVADALIIEVQVFPQDIDQVRVGQPVLLRFSAFNMRTTPELNGHVERVSPDLTIDQRTGFGHYTARIALNPGELDRLEGLTLTSGMPVEGFIQTGQRTALSYLTKPLTDQIMRSFRGE